MRLLRLLFSDYFLIVFITVIFASNIIVYSAADFYPDIPWIDRAAHFSGGFWAASLFFALFSRYPELRPYSSFLNSRPMSLVLAVLFVAFVGISWELFEYSFDAIGGLRDTAEDLILDLFGGVTSSLIYFAAFKNPSIPDRR